MNKKICSDRYDAVTRDTVLLTVLSMILQALGIFFNAKLSETAGTAAVGVMSLIFSFFSCIMILANGNIFVSTSRFISEETEGGGDIRRVMRYSLTFSALLSGTFAAISYLLSDTIAVDILKYPDLGKAVRILSFSLIPAAVGSCIKGYFHGLRRIKVPMWGDFSEFIFKWLCMGTLLMLFPRMNFYVITASAVCAGEVFSFFLYLFRFASSMKNDCFPAAEKPVMSSGKMYIKMNLPIVLSGYVQMIMSAANEAIVPAALLKYSSSSDTALSQYGMFEAMIIPAVFFPSAAMASMSNIMIPEAAAAMKSGGKRPRELVHNSFKKAFSYSFFIAGLFLVFGERAGNIICPSDSLVGQSLKILAPVIPFIYLEIILEGILKGMGRQNFCTVNSLAEYIIRISCVIIFVGIYGFYGVIISYYASNCASNIVRIIVVCRTSHAPFKLWDYIFRPLTVSAICCTCGVIMGKLFPETESTAAVSLQISAAAFVYYLLVSDHKISERKAIRSHT
ncbi:MAG: polysaccharide biosynthesis C-terminal domain-containing protein [Oscillospiraceae bacterium]|nr:polysaccharide biosynthesis C-terminal domain-containing protein [Oscillospiraceae bacterium]